MAFNIDALRHNTLKHGTYEYKEYQKERRKASYLTDSQRRELHNAQRALDKNITKTRRAIANETNDIRRDNLNERLSALKTLKSSMAQSTTIDGNKSYNSASSRLDAMETFNKGFRDTRSVNRTEQQAYEGVEIDWKLNEGQERFKKRVEKKFGSSEYDDDFERTPTYESMYEEYMNAIRAYDSEAAKEIASKISKAHDEYYERNVARARKVSRTR